MTDQKLLKNALEGNAKAAEQVCRMTWEPVYRFVYYRVQNREEAEDITQEAFARALSRDLPDGLGTEGFSAYLKTVARNIVRDRWRQTKRRGREADIFAVDPAGWAAEDQTDAQMQKMAIENALGKLAPEQRRVIELRIIEGYSAAEAAKMMNKKEGNVRVIQHRALHALAEILKETGESGEQKDG